MPVPRLHIITDTTVQHRYSHLDLAAMAWEAGNCAVQYRNKTWQREQDLVELQAIARLGRQVRGCLIVNDHLDLAFELQAQGVHLGQGDADPRTAATLLGPTAIIGATVHHRAELEALEGAPIHYIGVGPVFGSHSKATGLADLGIDGLADLAARSPWPVIAIGGIGPEDVEAVLAAGAHGVAIISAFCLSSDPIRVAKEMLIQLEGR